MDKSSLWDLACITQKCIFWGSSPLSIYSQNWDKKTEGGDFTGKETVNMFIHRGGFFLSLSLSTIMYYMLAAPLMGLVD